MGCLIEQFWFCLLLAFLLGLLIGWLLRARRCRAQLDDLLRSRRALENRNAELDAELHALREAAPSEGGSASAAPVAPAVSSVPAPESYPIEEVEGIGKGFGRALRALGIATTEDMLRHGGRDEQRAEIAEKIDHEQVDTRVVTSWASMCDLMRIPGVDGQAAELLEWTSVDSCQELAEQYPDGLLRRLEEVNRREHRVKTVPGRNDLVTWIGQAAGLEQRLWFGADQVAAEELASRGGYVIEEVEGIGPGYGRALRSHGIASTLDLLDRGRTPEQRRALASTLDLPRIDADVVTSWACMCDLLRIPGVMGQFAELLYFAGVKSVEQVARASAADLVDRLAKTDAEEHRVPELPELQQVAEWCEGARGLEGAIEL